MDRCAEMALARSAAPANIYGGATIELLTRSGYEVAQHGNNGNVTRRAMFSRPTRSEISVPLRARICSSALPLREQHLPPDRLPTRHV